MTNNLTTSALKLRRFRDSQKKRLLDLVSDIRVPMKYFFMFMTGRSFFCHVPPLLANALRPRCIEGRRNLSKSVLYNLKCRKACYTPSTQYMLSKEDKRSCTASPAFNTVNMALVAGGGCAPGGSARTAPCCTAQRTPRRSAGTTTP